jgi:CheY-like chemotaxis protein
MEAALDSLREMINALLDLSKLDAGLIEPHLETVSLRRLLKPLEAGFAATAAEQGLTFRLCVPDLAVRTDPALLETVLRNLIANALKFTARGGVLVGCRRCGRRLRLEVYDTGPGIPEDRLQQVFNAFERTQSQARGANEGLGLGLAIVRRLAGLLGIEVGARPVVGRGSCFTLDLPLAETELCVDRAAAVPADRAGALHGRRILVLEEDPTLRGALAEELLGHGAAVVAATESDLMARLQAFGTVDAAVFDQSRSDNSAAGRSTTLLAGLNRHLGAVVPAVMLTGATDSSILASIERAGWHWLSKPVDLAALLTTLQTLC